MAKGSVTKRSGSWYAVYRVAGRQKWEKAGSTKRSAERLLAKRMDEVHMDVYREPVRIVFRDFAAKWLEDYAKVSVKESTYVSYETIIRLHLNPAFGDRWLHQITAGDIQQFVSSKVSEDDLSSKSVVNMLVPLKEMFKHARIWGYVSRDPAELVEKPRVEQEEMDFLSPDEIRLFLNSVMPRHYGLFLTAVLTGLRRGELLALKWGDIDRNASQIVVRRSLYRGKFGSPKSKYAYRRVDMSPTLREALEEHRLVRVASELDLVFCNTEGQPLEPDNLIKRQFHTALDRAGLRRIRFHDLRHTYASLLISQGENIKYIQQQLGHSSAKTTLDRYGHLMPSRQNGAAHRLDQTVFGNSVRKLLENPVSEGIPTKGETSEAQEPQRLNLVAGAGFEPATFGL